MPKKLKEAVRIARFEIARVDGDYKAARLRWHETSQAVCEIVNCIWQTWLIWHVQNDSRRKIIEWLNAREQNVKAAGKCPVECYPKELGKQIYDTLTATFPQSHTRIIVLTLQSIRGLITKRKAATGKLPGWTAILLYRESLPSSTHKQPIPFDVQNTELLPPTEENGKDYRLEVRTWRIPPERGKKSGTSITDTITLRCTGRKVQSQVAILKKVFSGEYAFRGSNLLWDRRRKKWFAMICYRMPKLPRAAVDDGKSAVLVAGRTGPWRLRLDGRTHWFGGRGGYIAEQRRRIFLQRRSRSNHHRFTGTNAKGHGRARSQAWRWKFDQAWKAFVKRCNQMTAHDVIRRCVDKKAGNLIYIQPSGSWGESRFVSSAGKSDEWNDATTWEFFQLKTFLAQKCDELGINFSVVKHTESRRAEEDAALQV